jgi:hypothetical protein
MPRCVQPVENADWANRDAYTVSVTAVLVNSHVGAVNPKLFRRFHLSSNSMSSVFANNGILLQEIGGYRQLLCTRAVIFR